MRCELCMKKVSSGISVLPIGVFQRFNRGVSEVVIDRERGIHVQCLRELVDSVRSLGLAITELPHTLGEAPSTEQEEAPHGTAQNID